MEIQSPTIGKLAGALAKAQGEIKGAIKDSENPFFKSRFANLESVSEACRPALAKYELAVIQTTVPPDEFNVFSMLVTTLAHSSGEWVRSVYLIRPLKDDPQGFGSALSYARRYSLAAIVGVVQADDDAETAMDRRPQGSSIPRTTQPATPNRPPQSRGIESNAPAPTSAVRPLTQQAPNLNQWSGTPQNSPAPVPTNRDLWEPENPLEA